MNKSQTPPGERGDAPGRRGELLAVGRRLFTEHAYDELSMDDIARAAGVAKGLVYYYFESKRGYYVAVIEEAARELRERTDTDPSLPPAERLNLALDAYLGYVEEVSEGYRAIIAGGVGSDPEVRAILDRERARVAAVVAEGLTGTALMGPALRAALEGWMSFIEGVSLDWLAHRDLDRDAVRALLFRGLQGALAGARALDPKLPVEPDALG